MRKQASGLVVWGLLLWMLTGCSSGSQGQDPSKVRVELLTEPAPVKVSQQVKMIAQVSGLVKKEGVHVQFDIRKEGDGDFSQFLDAKPGENADYFIEKSFDSSGVYTVYIHLLQGELHLTKKKQLVVS